MNQNTLQVEKWQPWDYLLDVLDIIQEYDFIYVLKASQLGLSWLLAIYNDWVANFNKTANCLLLSQGETEAWELLSKVRFVHENLPLYLQMPSDKDNRAFLSFKGNHSEIRALPSTEKAGHGYQGSVITRDELARHPYARAHFRAVSRAVDSGGKLIEVSTANKEDASNYFQEKTKEFVFHPDTIKKVFPSGIELYTNPNRTKTCLVFLSWRLRPTRYEGLSLEEWFESRVKPRYTPMELEEQYPATIEDVFRESRTAAYFDIDALSDMEFQLCVPIKQTEIDTHNGIIRVYKPPITGCRYVLYTDPSDGVEDPFVTIVIDFVTGEIVASAVDKIKVDRAAQIHDYLTRTYNATQSFEYNAVGMAFGKCLRDLETPNPAPRYKPDGKVDPDPLRTGQSMSKEFKNAILGYLKFGISKRQIVAHDREFIQQAKLVQKDENGYPVTPRKLSFDWVMAVAGSWWLQKFIPRTPYRAYTVDL